MNNIQGASTYLKNSPNRMHQRSIALLNQYQNIAKKAKDQLEAIQAKKKYSIKINKINYKSLKIDPPSEYSQGQLNVPQTVKSNESLKVLQKKYSEKYFKKDSVKFQKKIGPILADQQDWQQHKNQIPKINKNAPFNKKDYKSLHEKLDSIENRIINIKQDLQRKKMEKIKMTIPKLTFIKSELQEDVQKLGLNGLVTQMPQHSLLHRFNGNPYSSHNKIYYISQLIKAYEDQRSLAREHLITSLNILKLLQNSKQLSEEEMLKKRLTLPRKEGYEDKITLIFDLDQTLIHCNDTTNPPYDIKLPIKFPTGQIIQAGINIRPYVAQIIKNLSKHFQIMIFTASHSCYANVVIDFIDPKKEWVHHRLFRQHCFLSAEGMYIKDLRIIDRDMSKMILVDNAAYSYAYQLENGVPIFPYYHGQIDFQLKMLQNYLMTFVSSSDIREINNKTFKLSQYKKYFNKPEKLIEELYLNN